MKLLLGVVLLALLLAGCGRESKTQAAPVKSGTNETSQNVPIEVKFATIAAGHFVAANDSSVTEAKALLDKASVKFRTSQTEIADTVVTLKNIADKEGMSFNMYQVLEAMPVIETRDVSNTDRFNSLITYYLTIRHSGQNHTEALAGLRDISQMSDDFGK